MNNNEMNIGEGIVTIPRSYQTELVEQAKEENLIVCLPTGSGKTYIAVMLIKEMAAVTRRSIDDGGKRTIFLVKTVALAHQQSDYIRIHVPVKIGRYYGELGVDLWEKEKWINEFEHHQVLVFTAQVFLDILDHNVFPLHKVNLLIFDECHHSTGKNCYAELMRRHYDKCHDPPRILGLTASLSSQKINRFKLMEAATKIENIYRSRLACSANQEKNYHGTSAQTHYIKCPSYKEQICENNESIMIVSNTIDSILHDLESYLAHQKAEREKIEDDLVELMLVADYLGENISEYNARSVDFTIFLQSEYISIGRLKKHLCNLKYLGDQLGIYGQLLASNALRKVLKSSQKLDLITDEQGKTLFNDAIERLDCLTDDILENLVKINEYKYEILFSSKVLSLFQRIKKNIDKNNLGRCIVFVERIFTAVILSKILIDLDKKCSPENNNQLKIKYVTGRGDRIKETSMIAKYQQQIIREFRMGEINILVATSVVEEGLDIPECNLVFRFNKPSNFSSYMQSKGRARAKQNASYVLLIDEPDENKLQKDQTIYSDYEEMEKMLYEGFSIDNVNDDFNNDDPNQLEPYRTDKGIVISAIRAAQIIYRYCCVLGNGRVCPPRILYRKTDQKRFISILTMPANCPIRDDIVCENKNKKLAKFECCLKMVELLHKKKELNDDCLPHRISSSMASDVSIESQLFKLCDELFEKKDDHTIETIPRKINIFPDKSIESSHMWYLYRIDISMQENIIGFIVPSELTELPEFCLYGANDEILTVDIVYVKKIDFTMYKNQLESFCKYLFENIFDKIVSNSQSNLKFNIEHSTFQLLPCLLNNLNEIDCERMSSICNRLNKPVKHISQICENELYTAWHLPHKPLCITMSSDTPSKRTSDLWPHKSKSETIKTYADYFENRLSNISIHRDCLMAAMKNIHDPRINYLYKTPISKKTKKKCITSLVPDPPVYYAIELLHYAPANQADLKLFYMLPSILVRLSQLYWVEQLRKMFASCLQSYSLMNVKLFKKCIEFNDCLKNIDSSSTITDVVTRQPSLPLTSLEYDLPIIESELRDEQPSPDVLLQAITRRSCAKEMNNENLESLGDCFLKLAVSMSLYYRYPLANAGLLTAKKITQISNENLYRLAVQKSLITYLNIDQIVFRGEDANWLPPGYIVNEIDSTIGQRYSYQKSKRKTFSDMIEALIGAFLISSNYKTTIEFMHWLGLDVIPIDKQSNLMELPSILHSHSSVNTNNQINKIVDDFFRDRAFAEIETKIQYVFQNKAYLIAAFTHPSNYANRITDCYERLEFLGDAILDFLITRHIFINYNENVTPGRVTDIRQDLSNNGRLAYLLVACRLHTYILHNSTDLFGQISSYAGDENFFPKDQSTEQYLSKDLDQWPDATAPKALADVFEALIGAIFLDSGNSLETVWRVVEPILRKYINQSINDPNLNPIRWFSEHEGMIIKECVDNEGERPIAVCVIQMTSDGPEYEGRGVNKKKAKINACRKALKQQQDHD